VFEHFSVFLKLFFDSRFTHDPQSTGVAKAVREAEMGKTTVASQSKACA
jgi:hypothetical protein